MRRLIEILRLQGPEAEKEHQDALSVAVLSVQDIAPLCTPPLTLDPQPQKASGPAKGDVASIYAHLIDFIVEACLLLGFEEFIGQHRSVSS